MVEDPCRAGVATYKYNMIERHRYKQNYVTRPANKERDEASNPPLHESPSPLSNITFDLIFKRSVIFTIPVGRLEILVCVIKLGHNFLSLFSLFLSP